MDATSDKDAWRSWLGGYGGHSSFQHLIAGESIYIQSRPGKQYSQHGLRIFVEPTGEGCSLTSSRSLNPRTKGFLRFWLGAVVVASLVTAIGSSSTIAAAPLSKLAWLVPLVMFMFGWSFVLLGRQLVKKEIVEMEEWLRTIFADVMIEHR